MSFIESAVLLAWVAVATLAFSVAALLRRVNDLDAQLNGGQASSVRMGPRLGEAIPPTPLLTEQTPAVMLFAESGCRSCKEVLPVFAEFAARGSKHEAQWLVVYRGARDSSNGALHGVSLHENRRDAFEQLGIGVTPYIVATTDKRVVVASEPVGSKSTLSNALAGLDLAIERSSDA